MKVLSGPQNDVVPGPRLVEYEGKLILVNSAEFPSKGRKIGGPYDDEDAAKRAYRRVLEDIRA